MAAKKKKQLFDAIRQGAGGALNGMSTWETPAAPPAPEQAQPLTQTADNFAPLQALIPTGPAATPQNYNPPEQQPLDLGNAADMAQQIRNLQRLGRHTKNEQASVLGDDEIGDYIRQRDQAAREWDNLSLGDALKNPIYAGGTLLNYLGYGVEDTKNKVLDPDRAKEIDRRVAAYNEATDYKPNTARAVIDRGAANFNAGTGNTLDFLVGENLERLGWKDNPVSKFADSLRSDQAVREGDYQRVREGKGKAGQIAMDVGSSAVEALPDMILMMLSYGQSGAANGAGELSRDGARLLGREAAGAGASKLAGQTALVRQIAENSVRNPAFWTSFSRTTGNYYYDARQNGASEREAALYALLAGVVNSQLEAGSGFQRLPFDLPNSPSALRAWVHSMFEEGREEVVQGIVERGLQNLTYGADNPLVSVKDENAVLNPLTVAKEFGMGAAVSAVLGAPSSISQGVSNVRNRPTAAEAQAEAETPAEARPAAPVEQTPQNVTELPVLNPAPQASADTEKTESAPVRSETRQSDDPWENVLNEYLGNEEVPTENTPPAAQNDEQARTFTPEDHIDNRTDDYIAKRSTKAFQHEHPELHEHFAAVAQRITEEAMVSIDSGATHVSKKNGGGTRTYYGKGLKKVVERSGLSRNQVIKVCQDIIHNQGSENYADAKRVEQALDALMSESSGDYFDADYKNKKGEITGGTKAGSYEEFLKSYDLLLALGEITEDEVRAEWEAQQAEKAAEQTQTEPTQTEPAPSEPTAAELKAQMEEMLGRPLTNADLDSMTNQELADRIRPAMEQSVPTDANGLPQGQGAMSTAFPYQEAPSQTNSTNGIFAEEERQTVNGLRPEDQTHQVRTNEDVDYHAKERFESDYDGEKADLYQSDKEWDVTDIAVAWRILEQETQKARETGDWDEVVRLKKIYRSKASNWGQVGHEMGRHAHAAADIVSEAAETLDGIRGKLPKGMTRAELMKDISADADTLERARKAETPDEQSKAAIELIERLSSKRKTGGFLFGLVMPSRVMKTTKWALQQAAKQNGGNDFLLNLAEAQLRARATDFLPTSPLEVLKTLRYMGMLSKIATISRNLEGNFGFDILESYSEDTGGVLSDLFMSLFTKQRSMPFDRSWFSKAKRKGAGEASIRAYLETALDADVSDTRGKFGTKAGGRTLKTVKSPVARFLSNLEKWSGYTLTVPDEFFKGGARAEHQRGLDALKAKGRLGADELQGAADETALQRTFQNKGRTAGVVTGIREALDENLALHDNRGGSFGVGTLGAPFAQVPANLGEQLLNYAGLPKGIAQVVNVIRKGSNATAEEQQAAARAFGRGMTGAEAVAVAVYLFTKGIINIVGLADDDDDKDLVKLRQTEGVSGVQINKDALSRALRGESTEWRYGDDLQSVGHLQPLNGLLAIGSLLADDLKENGEITADDAKNATLQAFLETYKDLPAFSSISNIITNYNYSQADTVGGKVDETAQRFLGDAASSLVPNFLSGIANGMDSGVVRETYDSNASVAENTLNSIKSKIPGLRETLPQALDNWGQGRQTTASPFQNWLNTNIRPGAVVPYHPNDVNQELYRLMDAQDLKAPARNPVKSVQTEDGKKELSHDERRTYQETAGSTMFEELQNLMDTAQYQNMTDAERATAWSEIMSFGRATGEQAVGGDKELPSWVERGNGSIAEKAGFFSILQSAKQALSEDGRGKAGAIIGAVLDRGMSEEDTLGVLAQGLTGNNAGTLEKIQNADDPLAFAKNYFGVYEARQTLPEDEQDRNAPQLQAILDSGVNDRTAMEQFRIVLGEDSTTYTKIETLRKAGMPLDNIVAFYNARNEEYAVNEETGKPRKRNKKEQIAWLMETYGYSYATAKYVYDEFAGNHK